MNTHSDTAKIQAEALIDLGAATAETKGSLTPNQPDGVQAEYIPTFGISQD